MATKTTSDPWVKSALQNDSLVADLLLTLKHSSSSSSLIKTTPSRRETIKILLPPGWSQKKHRSKSGGSNKGKEQRGSPTTHLSWSACSASDAGSDLYPPPPAVRSVKANEGASTSSYNNKSQKRKTFVDLKDEEGPLLNGRIRIKRVSISNQESTSKRVTLNQPMVTCENVKRIKIDSVQNRENKVERRMIEAETIVQNRENKVERRMVEAETTEATTTQRGFVLPDLNMAPDEDMTMMS